MESGPRSDRRLILLIEDDPDLRKLTKIVVDQRFHLETAPDGRKGIEMVRELNPDLVLLDIYMVGMTGYEVCRILKDNPETAAIPVIMFTAGAQRHEVVEGYAAGADDYITKPFETDDLLSRIEHLLNGQA